MIEEKKKNLRNRIKNGDYNLSDEDKYLLQNDINFTEELISMLSFNDGSYIVLKILLNIIGKHFNYDFEYLKENVDKNIYIKFLLIHIREESIFSFDLVKVYCNLSDLSIEDVEELKRECLKVKQEGKNFNISREDFIELLDKKDYNTISKVLYIDSYESMINDEITVRLNNEFPFEKYSLLFIGSNVDIFSDKLNSMNIIYSLIKKYPLSEIELDNIIKRLENGETLILEDELIEKINFYNLLDQNREKFDSIIKLIFKNDPLLFFKLTYMQCNDIKNYFPYIKEQLINKLNEDTVISSINCYLFIQNDQEILKKLMEIKQYKSVANYFDCIAYFDVLYSYIDTNYISINIEKFKQEYEKVNNKELLKKYISDRKIIIDFRDPIEKKDIDFFINEGLDGLVFELLFTQKYNFIDFFMEYSDYYKDKITNNLYYTTELLKKNFGEILTIGDDILKRFLEITLNHKQEYLNIILEMLNGPEFKLINLDVLFDNLLPYLNNKNISIDNLKILKNKFGSNIITYLKNPVINQILNMNKDQLILFVNLFPDAKYEMKDLENAFDSIVQSRFAMDNLEEMEIFHNILVYLDLNDNRYLELVDKLVLELDDKAINYLNSNLNIQIDNPKLYILNLLKNISIPSENRKKYLDELHQICIYYLDRKRGKYKNTFNIGMELELPYEFEPNQLNTALVKLCLSNDSFTIIKNILNTKVDSKVSYEMIQAAIDFYLGNISKDSLKYDVKIIQKLIPEIIKETTKYLKEIPYQIDYYYMDDIKKNPNIKKIYKMDSSFNFFQVLINLDIEKIENILKDPNNYKLFQEIMNKFKLNKIPNSMINYLNKLVLFDFSPTTLATFINYFSSIMKDIKEQDVRRLNLATILKYTAVYDSVSSIYKTILGDIDYKLIKRNPPDNQARRKTKNDQRIKEAADVVIECFKRQEITIPTFNEVISLKNSSKLRVVVGNFTNPCNVTHGERTGACMRIGGVGESLFDFCYQNKNGFHIRFEDPNTEKYVSRVSGFRNGNTVFLNELRFPCSNNYTSEDLLEVIKIVGGKLIEYSKDSDCPIENVVLHNDYVATGIKTVDLNVSDIKTGLPNFYSDVNRLAIVVSSRNKDGFVPLNFDKKNIPSYQVARDVVREFTSMEEFSKHSSRINAICQVLKYGSIDYINNFNLDNGFIFGIVGDDFYCYLDNDLNIIEEFIGIDSRGREELDRAKQKLEANKKTLINNKNGKDF